ncbi:MAG TPA: 50S ribosomal protein L11 methyltransferase [Virgibacillus sp.]|nr:50S ribosomal protein L11 methyltransferase [Virgibacillus sp.]
MKWYEVCVHTSNEANEAVSNVLHGFTSGGVTIEDPLDITKEHQTTFGEIYDLNQDDYPKEGIFIKTYLSEDPRRNGTLAEINQAIHNLKNHQLEIGKGDVTVREVDEEDWATAWKKFYKPVKISENVMIKPTWETLDSTTDSLVIDIDPGMAFGTGTHPTTVLCVQALERYVKQGDLVIDVGCGSGILSIASGLLGAKNVMAYDLDDVAISSTNYNASLNGLETTIHAQQNNLLDGINETVDVIVSNILAEIIVTFVDDAWECLNQEGYFITSGIISEKKEMVVSKLKESGFNIISSHEQNDWVVIVAQK